MTSTQKKVRRNLYHQLPSTDQRDDDDEGIDAIQTQGIKHDQTPDSKKLNQPKSKRFLVGTQLFLLKLLGE